MSPFIKIAKEFIYDSSKIIGVGEGRTTVYIGTWQSRTVAVKQIYCANPIELDKKYQEYLILLKCDRNANVITCYAVEKDLQSHLIYIALELCDGNLKQWMDGQIQDMPYNATLNLQILRQITEGLFHLHSKNILHRDLKPQDILLVRDGGTVVVKIADFGISRQLPSGVFSETLKTNFGTAGWRAPEVLNFISKGRNTKNRLSKAIDIFPLGLIIYYVLTGGKHPFGKMSTDWESNIKTYSSKSLHQSHFPKPELIGNICLIERMIVRDPKLRPSIDEILSNHIFWNGSKIGEFFVLAGNILPRFNRHHDVRRAIEREYNSVVYNSPQFGRPCADGWLNCTCADVKVYLKTNPFKTYHGQTLYQLIRAIRNLHGHRGELPQTVEKALGSTDSEFAEYWLSRFPFLLPTLWTTFKTLRGKAYIVQDVDRFYKCE